MNRGIPIGRLIDPSPPSRMRAVRGLFDLRRPSESAVRQFIQAMTRYKVTAPNVYLNNAIHTVCIAPPGAGKSTGLVIPFLRSCRDSAVILDVKGELYKHTHKYRRAMGQQVAALDPWHVVSKKPDSLNPFSWENPRSPEALDFARDLAESLVIRGPHDEMHWPDMAETFISGIAGAVLNFCTPEHRNLLTVCNYLADRTLLEKTIETMQGSTVWDDSLARLGHTMSHTGKDELESILSTSSRMVRFANSPAAAASLKTSSFDPGHLLKGRGLSVYLIIPAVHLRPMQGWTRLMLTTLYRALIRSGTQNQRIVRFVLDEAGTALGHMPVIDDMLSMGRGYGARVFLIYQSLAQLTKFFPDNQHQSVLSTTSNIFLGANDSATCEEISKRCGSETVLIESGSTSQNFTRQSPDKGGTASHSVSHGTSENWSFIGKSLARPEQVAALPDRVAITFTPGVGGPILTWVTRFYEEESGVLSLFRRARRAARTLSYSLLLAISSLFMVFCVCTIRFDAPSRAKVRAPPGKPSPTKHALTPSPLLKEKSWNASGGSSKR